MKRALRLYVTGGSQASRRAVEGLRTALAGKGVDEGELEVVDVLRHPDLAAADRVLATPTLLAAGRRIVGELRDGEALRRALDGRNG